MLASERGCTNRSANSWATLTALDVKVSIWLGEQGFFMKHWFPKLKWATGGYIKQVLMYPQSNFNLQFSFHFKWNNIAVYMEQWEESQCKWLLFKVAYAEKFTWPVQNIKSFVAILNIALYSLIFNNPLSLSLSYDALCMCAIFSYGKRKQRVKDYP